MDADSSGIEATCRDYIEGWYDGDATRMENALHPELAKHTLARAGNDLSLVAHTQQSMIELTARVEPQPAADRRAEITILAATDNFAAVRLISAEMVDFLHLVRFPQGWRIVHALWGPGSGELIERG